jgi:hypothetical protein
MIIETLALREKARNDLLSIREKMIGIALIIDEDQLNKYVTNDFVPPDSDDDSDSSSVASCHVGMEKTLFFDESIINSNKNRKKEQNNNEDWERFEGWAFDIKKPQLTPARTEADDSTCKDTTSSEEDEEDEHGNYIVNSKHRDIPPRRRKLVSTKPKVSYSIHEERKSVPGEELHVTDPEPSFSDMYNEEDSEVHYDFSTPIHISRDVENSILEAKFLHRIANEDVRFETDSEAVDSWAPNNNETRSSASTSISGCGVGGGKNSIDVELSCDPARIAFREIMLMAAASQASSQQGSEDSDETPPLPAVPTNSPIESPRRRKIQAGNRGTAGAHTWAGFRFSSIGRAT